LALDAGWVACGEKLNRSLCSLKIKLFLDAGGGDWGLFNAQLALDASIISQSCACLRHKACFAGIIGLRVGGFCQTTCTTVFVFRKIEGGNMSMNACARKGSGWGVAKQH